MSDKLHEKGLYRVSFSPSYNKIRENLFFVLVEPESRGNVGATARAMKTCGFKNLILVNPKEKNHPETMWMAHQSEEILESAKIVEIVGRRNFRYAFSYCNDTTKKIISISLLYS